MLPRENIKEIKQPKRMASHSVDTSRVDRSLDPETPAPGPRSHTSWPADSASRKPSETPSTGTPSVAAHTRIPNRFPPGTLHQCPHALRGFHRLSSTPGRPCGRPCSPTHFQVPPFRCGILIGTPTLLLLSLQNNKS